MSNKLIHCWTALTCEPWLIVPAVHEKLTDIVWKHMAGGEIEKAQHELAAQMPAKPIARTFDLVNRTAVIPIEGVIGRKFSDVLQSSGVVSIDIAERMLMAAAGDDEVDAILMVYDSPGGRTTGVPEMARSIQRVDASIKPVIAYADGMLGSAAYWLASQSSHIIATESADVGAIGVYVAVLDERRNYEMQGYGVDVIQNEGATFKGMGMPGTSLSPEQRAFLQERVNRTGGQFKEAVRQGREKAISDDVMRGQSFAAVDAVKNGLIDALGTYDEALVVAASYGELKRQMRKK